VAGALLWRERIPMPRPVESGARDREPLLAAALGA
jgi:hypothetical protein